MPAPPLPARGAAALLAILSGAPGCAGAPLSEPQAVPELEEAVDPRATLAVDDVVRVRVFGHPELSTTEEGARLDHQGRLHLPLAGPVQVAGYTVDEASGAVEVALARYLKRPSVVLDVVSYAPRVLYVLGEVEQPGAHGLHRPLTALQALSLSGPFRPGADRAQIALLRVEGERLDVRFFDAATPGVDGLVPVRPDDVIFVRQTGAGSFREQILPVIQGAALPVSAVASIVLASEALDN